MPQNPGDAGSWDSSSGGEDDVETYGEDNKINLTSHPDPRLCNAWNCQRCFDCSINAWYLSKVDCGNPKGWIAGTGFRQRRGQACHPCIKAHAFSQFC